RRSSDLVVLTLDVVDMVAAHDGSGRDAQQVHAAHVVEPALSEVVDVVAHDVIALGRARQVVPHPADRYTGVGEFADLVVGDDVVRSVLEQHRDGTAIDLAAALGRAVTDLVGAIEIGGEGIDAAARADGARTEVSEGDTRDEVPAGPGTERDAVAADALYGSARHGAAPREREAERGGHGRGGLHVGGVAAVGGQL